MNSIAKLLLVSTIACTLTMSGCGSESQSTDTESHTGHDEHEGHDHGEDGLHDHVHAAGSHGDHGDKIDLGMVTIAGTTLRAYTGGVIEPSSVVRLDVLREDGPEPVAVRVWIGDEAATATRKSKAMGDSVDYHAEVEVPSELNPESSIWIEIETADGDRVAAAIPISG